MPVHAQFVIMELTISISVLFLHQCPLFAESEKINIMYISIFICIHTFTGLQVLTLFPIHKSMSKDLIQLASILKI